MKRIIQILIVLYSSFCFSQQLVYRPMNPFFGGETFNYQMMLSAANAQNSFKDPDLEREKKSELDQFKERLNNQLLSQLSRQLFDQQLGNGLKEGTFVFGQLSVDIFESAQGLVVNLLNIDSGEQTQIIMPTY